MIKNIFAVALLGLASASLYAATPTTFDGNQDVTPTECVLLANAVKLGVSTNVVGAFACDETLNLVQVGACSTGGSRSIGAACGPGSAATGGTSPNVAGCTYGGATAQVNSTIPSFKAFYTDSRGGVMQEAPLGTRCEETALGGIGNWTPAATP